MHELPSSFNTDLLAKCNRGLEDWIDFCDHWRKEGFGKWIVETSSSSSFPHWYAINNYLLEVIFHRRMVTYPCRILIPSKADAFFIPYYRGLEALEYLYGEKKHLRDTQGASLINWLKQYATELWSRYIGADHFMALGRTSWDFFRQNETSWGTKLLQQPELASVTALVLEKMPWKAAVQEAVLCPTSFHPPSHAALQEWMHKVRNINQPALFSFFGAARPGEPGDIRMELIEHCNASARCTFTDCTGISCGENPQVVLSAFMDANFCLQPRGDTPTRRSAFDSMIAGCKPIFFHKDSAYTQYKWHLPGDSESYSVFIDQRDIQHGMKVEDNLKKFTQEQIVSLRERVISLLPNIVYLNVSSPGEMEQ
ncbi:hypothetical protein BDL97_01G188700 [Sphagnum fallax]|nr:hypothetical protein BDL97_01G188700 [Sphagnum fallax]